MIKNKKSPNVMNPCNSHIGTITLNEDTVLHMVPVDNYFQRLINCEVSLVLFVKTLSNFKVFNAS